VSQLWKFSPNRRDEIVRDLRLVHSRADRVWAGFDNAAFFQPLGTGWSPAQNVVHLTKSVRPVVKAIGLPKFVLAVMFGRAKQGSGNYVALGDRYQGLLAAGAGAGGFMPREVPPPANPREARAELVAGFADAVEQLAHRSDIWSETALDRYRLPHPLLGKLTVREMLFFTVLHIAHHASKVETRQAAAESVPGNELRERF
jgi:DinB superfamily